MANNTDFDKLTSKYIFTGVIRTLSQLHIGSGEKGETINRNIPYIPGSSLKGVLRSVASALVNAWGEKSSDIESSYYIDRLFGSTEVAAHVQIFDCLPVGWQENAEKIELKKKMGVAINPITGAAQRGALFSMETVSPGTEFEFKLITENIPIEENPDDISVKVLKFLIDELVNGNITIGGKTTSGLGRITLVNLKVKGLKKESIEQLKLDYEEVQFSSGG